MVDLDVESDERARDPHFAGYRVQLMWDVLQRIYNGTLKVSVFWYDSYCVQALFDYEKHLQYHIL